MARSGLRWVLLVLLFSLLPVCSHALVEEKSSIIGSFAATAEQQKSGITVRLLDSYFLNEVARTVTDSNGQFVLKHLVPGLYLITIETASMQGLMKRVQVTSDSPTFIDIRPLLSQEELKDHNAWEKFKWTIRVAERNPLRDEEGSVNPVEPLERDGFMAMLRNFQEANNIEGQIAYMNVGSDPTSTSINHQMAQFAVQGKMEGAGVWSVNGNFLDGLRSSYMAGGAFSYRLSDHNLQVAASANDLLVARYPELVDRQRIVRFLQNTDGILPQESTPWIASVDLQDDWKVLDKIEVGYGARMDYYGYLQDDTVGYSPRVQVTYRVDPIFSIHGGYYRNTSAPGNFYQQSREVHPYIHDIAFVPYGGSLQSETVVGFESGFDFVTDDFTFSLVYQVDEANNKIATIDLSDSPVNQQLQSIRPFVIFNARDIKSRGVGITASKQLSRMLSAMISYNVSQSIPVYIVEKRTFSQRRLYFVDGLTQQDFHDFQAGISADIDETQTRVNASWKWSSGSPLVFGRPEDNVPLSALDVEVTQALPVRVFNESQLRLLLAVKNLLDQNPNINSNADFQRALVYGMPRTIAGGVLVQF